MQRRRFLALAGTGAAASLGGCLGALRSGGDSPTPDPNTSVGVSEALTGLSNPWGLAVLPDESGLLVTEQGGRLLLADPETGETTDLAGVPEVHARGQGGLLDVTLHPDFGSNGLVYLTYSVSGEGGSTTELGRGRLDTEDGRLAEFETVYTARPFVQSSGHYGSRVVFGPEGYVYLSVGDRQFKNFGPDHVGQTLSDDLGSVLRLHDDGTIPEDNPFVDDPDASGAIWTYGNRNPQGLTVHPDTGEVWETEFGERDGDEINVLERGANYGWPVADNSCGYGSDDPVGVSHDAREDVVAPVYGWPCGTGGFPPSGATFYDGEAFPDWRGDLFVAGLAKQYLAHFTVDGREVTEVGPLLTERGQRIRDVTVGPVSGHLYAAVDAGDAPVLRITPE